MTKQEFLLSYRRAMHEFDAACDELKEYRSRYEGIKAITYSDMPKAHNTERDLSDTFAKIEKATARCAETCNRCMGIMENVQTAIDGVEDIEQRRVLRMRYMYGMRWEDIETTMLYSRQWLDVLRKRGIKNLKVVNNGKRKNNDGV